MRRIGSAGSKGACVNSTALGRPATGAELYLAHQQGPQGAAALLHNPTANAVSVLTPLYGSAAKAQAAITQNGGTPDMTAGQFANMWESKYNAPAGASSAQPSAATASPSGFGTSTAGSGPANVPATADDLKGTPFAYATKNIYTGELTNTVRADQISSLGPQANQQLGEQYWLTGKLPDALGRAGSEKARDDAINYAAQKSQSLGLTPSQDAMRYATVAAANVTRGTMIGQQAQLSTAENNAIDNANQIKTLLPAAAAKYGVSTINDLQQLIKRNTQDPQLAALDTALKDFQGDYSKVMFSNANGSGGSGGQGDREGVAEHFDAQDNIPVTLSKLNQATKAMRFRTTEFGNEIGRLGNVSQSGSTNPADWQKLSSPFTPVDANAIANIPDAAIAALKQQPNRAAEFEQQFGPGTASVVMSR